MMIFAIIISTMIVVALVVFAMELHLYKKYEAKRGRPYTRNSSAGESHSAPIAS